MVSVVQASSSAMLDIPIPLGPLGRADAEVLDDHPHMITQCMLHSKYEFCCYNNNVC